MISDETWKEVKISDLFDIVLSKGDNQANLLDDGLFPLVSAGFYNNGICKYIKCGDGISEIFHAPALTVDMFGKTFYQENDFYAVSHGRVNILLPKFNMTKNVGIFIATIMNKCFFNKYSFTKMCSSNKLKKETIKLPVYKNKIYWEYMDNYIEKLMYKNNIYMEKILEILPKSATKISVDNWREFKIGDLFSVCRPSSRSQSSYENGNVPFVASGNYNNGVVKNVMPKENEALDKGNCISISPVDGSAFYQKSDFLGRGGAGSSIILLYNENLNEYIGLFICTIIKKVCNKYFYSNMANKETIKSEVIKLPVDKNNNPDWDYMEKFIKTLEVSI